ncbi:hypothetical protein HJC10_08665 [Corallococcus exiguus]|nr:hypothetical protein [Corallococcus exiguus]
MQNVLFDIREWRTGMDGTPECCAEWALDAVWTQKVLVGEFAVYAFEPSVGRGLRRGPRGDGGARLNQRSRLLDVWSVAEADFSGPGAICRSGIVSGRLGAANQEGHMISHANRFIHLELEPEAVSPYALMGTIRVMGDEGRIQDEQTYINAWLWALDAGLERVQRESPARVKLFSDPDALSFAHEEGVLVITYEDQEARVRDVAAFRQALRESARHLKDLRDEAERMEVAKRIHSDIFRLLDGVRQRPFMYVTGNEPLGLAHLQSLEQILWGYSCALRHHGILEPGLDFSVKFGAYLYETRGWSTSCGPAAAIHKAAGSDPAAWPLYWKLVDEFRESLTRPNPLPE